MLTVASACLIPGIPNNLSLGTSVLMFQLELDTSLCEDRIPVEGYCSLLLLAFIPPSHIFHPQSLLLQRKLSLYIYRELLYELPSSCTIIPQM